MPQTCGGEEEVGESVVCSIGEGNLWESKRGRQTVSDTAGACGPPGLTQPTPAQPPPRRATQLAAVAKQMVGSAALRAVSALETVHHLHRAIFIELSVR